MRYPRLAQSRAGMTLMELIVGIVITAAVATVGAAAFASIIDHRRVILTASTEVERASALREMLRSWIASGSVRITTGGARGRNNAAAVRRIEIERLNASSIQAVTAAASTGDELTFTTSALTPSMAPETIVRLFVDGDPNTDEVGLTIEYQGPNNAPLQRKQIDPSILQMTVEFLDRRTNQWYPYSQAASTQPIAVRLWFPQPEGVQDAPIVPDLLQYPLLFVIGQQSTTQGGR